jgi:hypothetical protein
VVARVVAMLVAPGSWLFTQSFGPWRDGVAELVCGLEERAGFGLVAEA